MNNLMQFTNKQNIQLLWEVLLDELQINNNNKSLLTLGRCGYRGGDTPGSVRSMGSPAPDSGTWGVAFTHSHTRAHTHSPKPKCSRQTSVSL